MCSYVYICLYVHVLIYAAVSESNDSTLLLRTQNVKAKCKGLILYQANPGPRQQLLYLLGNTADQILLLFCILFSFNLLMGESLQRGFEKVRSTQETIAVNTLILKCNSFRILNVYNPQAVCIYSTALEHFTKQKQKHF